MRSQCVYAPFIHPRALNRVCRRYDLSSRSATTFLSKHNRNMQTGLLHISDVMRLSPRVTRVLGQNPGPMTLQGTNTYLVQPASSPLAPIVLIDTGSPQSADLWLTNLFLHLSSNALLPLAQQDAPDVAIGVTNDSVNATLPVISDIILTHKHLDHTGGLARLLESLHEKGMPPPRVWKFPHGISEPPTSASSGDGGDPVLLTQEEKKLDLHAIPQKPFEYVKTVRELEKEKEDPPRPEPASHVFPVPPTQSNNADPNPDRTLATQLEWGYFTPNPKPGPGSDGALHWLQEGSVIKVSDDKFGPGKGGSVTLRVIHTPGHTSDSISLILEEENALFTGDTVLGEGSTVVSDLMSYMTSLDRLLALTPSRLYPAHGEQLSTSDAAQAHLRKYIAHRKDRETQILALLAEQAASINDIVDKIYDQPNETIKKAAAASVKSTLDKLAIERKVASEASTWKLVQAKEVDGVDKRA